VRARKARRIVFSIVLSRQPSPALLSFKLTEVETKFPFATSISEFSRNQDPLQTSLALSSFCALWMALPVLYDDGGYSGGSIERPALKKLLTDIQSRAVDVVVVYKVDRLTRSLADFAKIVEIFDAAGVSFVSVIFRKTRPVLKS
jgi:hypothetical protein